MSNTVTVFRSKKSDKLIYIHCECHNASYSTFKAFEEDHPGFDWKGPGIRTMHK